MTGIPVLCEPKTAAGSRTLAVPPHLLGALADHLERFAPPRRLMHGRSRAWTVSRYDRRC